MVNISIGSLRIAAIFCLALITICFVGIISQVYSDSFGYLAVIFDFDRATNISTWYQSALFLLSTILLNLIALIKKGTKNKFYLHWFILSVVPLFLSLDKMLSFHTVFIEIGRKISETSGAVHYFGVALCVGLIYTIILLYLTLHDDIPKSTQLLILISSAIYVEGAVGIELIRARLADLPQHSHIFYLLILTLKEFLETISIIVFIYALISYVSVHIKDVQFIIEDRF